MLQVGALSRRKNQDGLLRACRDDTVPLVLLGKASPYEPDYAAEVQSLARSRPNTVIIERVNQEQLAQLYRCAAVHVLPSWSERPGLVTLEAVACGCPAVTSRFAPVWEYVSDGVEYCDPRRPASIRDAIRAGKSRTVSTGAADQVRANCTWERTARRVCGRSRTRVGA